jgi:metal-responsive CopG/Arc/MetJ family transcriptional regulator
MGSDESEDHMVAVTAKVPRQLRDRLDEESANDEPRSATIRRLLRTALDGADRRAIQAAGGVAGVAYIVIWFFARSDASLAALGGAYIAVTLLWANYPSVSNTFQN